MNLSINASEAESAPPAQPVGVGINEDEMEIIDLNWCARQELNLRPTGSTSPNGYTDSQKTSANTDDQLDRNGSTDIHLSTTLQPPCNQHSPHPNWHPPVNGQGAHLRNAPQEQKDPSITQPVVNANALDYHETATYRLSAQLPPFPRRHRLRVGPQTFLRLSCFGF